MSAARIDHAEEARRIVEQFRAPSPEGAQMITEAQVHATLALVEQQRIANRLALGMYVNANGSRPGQFAVTQVTGMSTVEVHPDIREGLGLS